ncbi:nicotinamide-nucleotide adenylyltransferase 2 [Cordyceps fumosorosea ARSEF 2679]|uniref:Nicotinamide-nucleotide adenylyltransferase 2 n=1 Tax=Cordyceps fumosorosea (strain ARSEF 2679) TaxID=1081104 RepID=A0A167WM86_CORFA|nr:nicotinamide-nucleotide adenylyltransferase 2 [Cordyceps fumosorosea ARSEF 2679]OAA63966.1 nicotinamide-nucleotide adenylyltransferase 2 [Cordyceps fumosorosea ARSEF 2679]
MDALNTTTTTTMTNGVAAAAAVVTNGTAMAHNDDDHHAATTTTTTTTAAAEAPTTTMRPYTLPVDKLRRRLTRPGKTPLVLVACGSFSPITELHVQMFAMAGRHVATSRGPAGAFEVVGSYLSPVSDAYKKPALAPAPHRLAMCELAAADADVMVDPWEALRCDAATREPVYTSTVDVLHHVDAEVNRDGGIETPDGMGKVRARVALLMGADVAATMGDARLWPVADVDGILGRYGAFVVERPAQTRTEEALAPLRPRYDETLWVVQAFDNDVSSTKIRAQLRSGERVLDLAPRVYEYIKTHDLYHEETGHAKTNGVVQ